MDHSFYQTKKSTCLLSLQSFKQLISYMLDKILKYLILPLYLPSTNQAVWEMPIQNPKKICHSHYTFKNRSNSDRESQSFQLYAITPWRKCTTITARSCVCAMRSSPGFWQQAVSISSSRTCEMSSSGMTDAGITGCGWLPSSPDPRSRPVRITLVCLRESRAPADDRPEDPPPLPPTPELQRLLEDLDCNFFFLIWQHTLRTTSKSLWLY